jgi:hypothetical protein
MMMMIIPVCLGVFTVVYHHHQTIFRAHFALVIRKNENGKILSPKVAHLTFM